MLTRDREIGTSLSKAHPEDRAILDLSLRRKVKDDVVAAVLRLQPEEVAPRRQAAIDRLAADLGIYDDAERARLSDQLADLPADQWPAEPGAMPSRPASPPDPPAPPPKEPESKEPERPRRRRPGLAVAVVVVGALLGGLVGLLLFGGDADDDGNGGSAPATAEAPREPVVKDVELTPLAADFPGRGTARIEGSGTDSRLVMSLSDLPPREEAYEVWLYNDLTDARPVDRVVGSTLEVDEALPADPSGYKYIDVSREPIDDNPNHSGASLMRVPISDLLEGRRPDGR